MAPCSPAARTRSRARSSASATWATSNARISRRPLTPSPAPSSAWATRGPPSSRPEAHRMFRVLVTERIADDGLEILRGQAQVDVRLRLSPVELVQAVEGYQALVVRSETKVTADVIEA